MRRFKSERKAAAYQQPDTWNLLVHLIRYGSCRRIVLSVGALSCPQLPQTLYKEPIGFVQLSASISLWLSAYGHGLEDAILVATSFEFEALNDLERELLVTSRFLVLIGSDYNIPPAQYAFSRSHISSIAAVGGVSMPGSDCAQGIYLANGSPKNRAREQDFQVLAIMAVFNEKDIIERSIRHLVSQQIDVYVMDNWSTDGTFEALSGELREYLYGLERFPASGPSETFSLSQQLERKERLARGTSAQWIMHCDADEFRYSPFANVSLRDALHFIDTQGFDAVNHTVIEFPPNETTPDAVGDPEATFKYFRFSELDCDLWRVNCWKRTDQPAGLIRSGGHHIDLDNAKIYPLNFLLKHYPFRSQTQGQKKVFRDRLPRFAASERQSGWHTHYDHYLPDRSFIENLVYLLPFDEAAFSARFFVERLTANGVRRAMPRILSN